MSSAYKASPIRGLETFPYHDKLNYSPVIPVIAPIAPVITPFANEENQKLNQLLYEKNLEITRLYEQNNSLRKSYEDQITTYKKMVEALQIQLSQKQRLGDVQFLKIKERFQKMSSEQSASLKTIHSHEIQFLLKQISQQRAANDKQTLKLTLKDQQIQTLKQSYERQISSSVNETNCLNKLISKLQQDKNKEIRDLSSKRQLQKSRTSGLISSRRSNSTFMDKQVRKLNEDVLQKTIQIQNISRELNRQRKKLEDTLRNHGNAIKDIRQKYEEQIQQNSKQFARVEKSLKLQIKETKQQIIGFIQQIETLKTSVNLGQKQRIYLKQQVQNKKQEIQNLKGSLQRQRQEHAHQMSNIMKDRRKSRSNIGSSRSIISLKQSGVIMGDQQSNNLNKFDSQFGGSGRLEKNLHPIKQQSPDRIQHKDYSRQLADSHLQDQEPIETQIQRAVYHYDNLIEQLKCNHLQELQLLKINEKKLRSRLEEKEHQLLDILTKFSPLVKIHAGQKSLEEDRKQRIQRHWKADVTLLQVLLRKYRIKIFE